MATVRKRGIRWQVQVRRKGHRNFSKSFLFRDDALRWAREIERSVDRGEVLSDGTSTPKIFTEILTRYDQEIIPQKRSAAFQHFHMRMILRHAISTILIKNLTASDICRFRDDRLVEVSAATVRKELGIIQHAVKIARTEWGHRFREEVLQPIAKPTASNARTRRLEADELPALLEALSDCRNPMIAKVFAFALATGMRRGEILSLDWCNVDLQARTAHLPITKNGLSRTVPLSPTAVATLSSLGQQTAGVVFPVSANALRLAWERAKRRAGITDLRFHDLRHEAISRFFEIGLSIPEVSVISGHKDPRMLFRYTHLRPEDIAAKLSAGSLPNR